MFSLFPERYNTTSYKNDRFDRIDRRLENLEKVISGLDLLKGEKNRNKKDNGPI